MRNFHLLSRLFISRANNTDVFMFTLFHGDLDLWHRLTEHMPVVAAVNTQIQHWQRKAIKWLTCKLPWWIVVRGATRWITLLQPLFTYTARMVVNHPQWRLSTAEPNILCPLLTRKPCFGLLELINSEALFLKVLPKLKDSFLPKLNWYRLFFISHILCEKQCSIS